ncbi:hypothetical protein LJR225_000169 [Phenylobacterium sp. LjRoot225]|uniref:CC0125/CC1285 family lipoprotein n=1 Tax=Phenylobacterium sp. LjRoot225 TaxID=3342285 RepID=UPI003ECF31A9
MKPFLLAAAAALTLAACATAPTVYQPAAGPTAIGYSEYRIEPGRYRVTFQGGSGAPPEQVMDFALMRAADLALAEGYDWFRVSDRSMRATGGGSRGPRISLGVGGADFGRRSAVGVGVGTGFDLGGGGGGAAAATLEVFMGRGPKPEGVDVYDARAVRRTLGRPA